ERAGAPACRWTRPFATIRVRLPPGDYRLRLDAGFPACSRNGAVKLFFNSQILKASEDGEFSVPRSAFRPGEQLLSVACPPFYPARLGLLDSRELGIALFALRFAPIV